MIRPITLLPIFEFSIAGLFVPIGSNFFSDQIIVYNMVGLIRLHDCKNSNCFLPTAAPSVAWLNDWLTDWLLLLFFNNTSRLLPFVYLIFIVNLTEITYNGPSRMLQSMDQLIWFCLTWRQAKVSKKLAWPELDVKHISVFGFKLLSLMSSKSDWIGPFKRSSMLLE